jgi:hypothetical protein
MHFGLLKRKKSKKLSSRKRLYPKPSPVGQCLKAVAYCKILFLQNGQTVAIQLAANAKHRLFY